MRGAGLTLRVKRHLARDGSKLLLAFVTAAADRLAVQSDRLAVEKWLTEERSLESGGGARFGVDSKPATRVVRVGDLRRCATRGSWHSSFPLGSLSSPPPPKRPVDANHRKL